MDFVTDNIAIGNTLDAADQAGLQAAGIRSILCLNGQLDGRAAEDCGVDELTCLNLIDGKGNDPWRFERAVRAVGLHSTHRPKLLVHCQAGRSRSVMVVACHLVRQNGWDLIQALDFIQSKHSNMLPPHQLIHLWDVNNEGCIA